MTVSWLWRRCRPEALLYALACLSLSCASWESPQAPLPPPLPAPVVMLNPGDAVEVKYLYWPELNTTQEVRPDGKITLELVGDVTAAGQTPEQLGKQLLDLYGPRLKQPAISVVVRSLAGQRIYVGGEVHQPGMLPVQGRLTVLEAIAMAGGYNKMSARLSDVIVIRQVGEKIYAAKLDLRGAYRGGAAEPYYLAPRDIVFVSRTRIDLIDQWVSQYINMTVPQTLFNISHQANPHTIIGYGRSN